MFGDNLNPDRTRMVDFPKPPRAQQGGSRRGGSLAMWGFTHYVGWIREPRLF